MATYSTRFDVINCNSRRILAEVGSSYDSPRIGLPSAKQRLALFQNLQPPLGFRSAEADLLGRAIDHAFDRLQIGQHQLGVDRFDIAKRIDAAFDVDDVLIFVAANDVQDRVDVSQVAQELVAEPFALRRAAHQAGDIDQLKNRGDDFFGFDVPIDRRQPRIGNRDGADVRLDRAERIVLAGDARRRERVEQRAFSDVR